MKDRRYIEDQDVVETEGRIRMIYRVRNGLLYKYFVEDITQTDAKEKLVGVEGDGFIVGRNLNGDKVAFSAPPFEGLRKFDEETKRIIGLIEG